MVDISKLAVGAQIKVNGKPYTVKSMETIGSTRPRTKVFLRNPRLTEYEMYSMSDRWFIGIPHHRFGIQRVKPVESFEVVGDEAEAKTAETADAVNKLLKE